MKKTILLYVLLAMVMNLAELHARRLPVTQSGSEKAMLDVGRLMDSHQTIRYNDSKMAYMSWKTFDVEKNETFLFKNNKNGIVNQVLSKKSSHLEGTIRSYRDNGQTIGGAVYLINPNGIQVHQGFRFEGDSLHLELAPQSQNVHLELCGEKEFRLLGGSLKLTSRGSITGNACFSLAKQAILRLTTPEKQSIFLGDVRLEKGSILSLISRQNLKIKEIFIGDGASAILDIFNNVHFNKIFMENGAVFLGEKIGRNMTILEVLAQDFVTILLGVGRDLTVQRNFQVGNEAALIRMKAGQNLKLHELNLGNSVAEMSAAKNLTLGGLKNKDADVLLAAQYGTWSWQDAPADKVAMEVSPVDLGKEPSMDTTQLLSSSSEFNIARGTEISTLQQGEEIVKKELAPHQHYTDEELDNLLSELLN